MLSRRALIALLSALTVGSTVVLTACAADSSDENASEPTDDEVKANALGALGASCGVKKCKAGLLCKKPSSGPPAGAMGLPLPPASATSHGPPPGALGLPMNPDTGKCSTPENGEEGGFCNSHVKCDPGLTCDIPPVAPSTGGGMHPGRMGMPILPHGTCKPKSSGPPPGTMGLPIHQ